MEYGILSGSIIAQHNQEKIQICGPIMILLIAAYPGQNLLVLDQPLVGSKEIRFL